MTHTSARDPIQTVRALEEQLEAAPRSRRPGAHAALRYRLGLALAELPVGPRQLNLSKALGHYDRAAELFRPDTHPVEHARVLNAKGAALRELGRTAEAVTACRTAVQTADGHSPAWERAAAENNLALALSDAGSHEEAVTLARRSAERFEATKDADDTREDLAPQRVMASHNLGQVLAAAGRHREAAEVYGRAIPHVDVEQLPYQWALLHHARGVSAAAVGDIDEAIAAFGEALAVFTRARHPFQHGMAKHNLGLAWAQRPDPPALRRAVACFADSLAVFDPRLHREVWQRAYDNLRQAQEALAQAGHDAGQVEHFAALLAEAETAERLGLARERVMRLLDLPEPHRSDKLAELSLATLLLPEPQAIVVLTSLFEVLLELPDDLLQVGLTAHLTAQRSVPADVVDDADWVLERAIAEGMLAPQRLRVRDHLTALGYQRP